MAKKKGLPAYQKNYLNATRANIEALAASLSGDRSAAKSTGLSAIDAAAQNARSTLNSLTKQFTARQARDFVGMNRTLQSVGREGSLDKAKAEVSGNFQGGFEAADARTAGAARVVGATAKGAVRYSKATSGALALIKAGVAGAKAEAQTALAETISDRAEIDATTIFNAEQDLLQQKVAFQQEKAAIRLEQRMEERANEQGYGEDYRAASATVNEAAMSMTRTEALGVLTAMQYQYNLGPQAMERLRSQVDALWTSPEGSSHSTLYQGDTEAATNEFGEPFTYRGSRQEAVVKKEVATIIHMALRGEPQNGGDEWTLAALKDHLFTEIFSSDGVPAFPESFILQAMAYAEHVWVNNITGIPRDAAGNPFPGNVLTTAETGNAPPAAVGKGGPTSAST